MPGFHLLRTSPVANTPNVDVFCCWKDCTNVHRLVDVFESPISLPYVATFLRTSAYLLRLATEGLIGRGCPRTFRMFLLMSGMILEWRIGSSESVSELSSMQPPRTNDDFALSPSRVIRAIWCARALAYWISIFLYRAWAMRSEVTRLLSLVVNGIFKWRW